MTKIGRKKKLQKFLDKYFEKDTHEKFLTSKHDLLGKRPVDMLDSDKDFKKLWDMLQEILSGGFS